MLCLTCAVSAVSNLCCVSYDNAVKCYAKYFNVKTSENKLLKVILQRLKLEGACVLLCV